VKRHLISDLESKVNKQNIGARPGLQPVLHEVVFSVPGCVHPRGNPSRNVPIFRMPKGTFLDAVLLGRIPASVSIYAVQKTAADAMAAPGSCHFPLETLVGSRFEYNAIIAAQLILASSL
jgi:hypothetical protein